MTQSEALIEVVKILNSNGITLNEETVILSENIDFFQASQIEDEMEEIVFQSASGEDCVFQIIDDKLVVTEC
jgi:hypothetical protein